MDKLSDDLVEYVLYFSHNEFGILARICTRITNCFKKLCRKPTTSKYLLKPFKLFQWLYYEYDCPITETTFLLASKFSNYRNSIKWLRERSSAWTKSCLESVVEKGDLGMVAWMRYSTPPCEMSEWTYYLAARNGHIHILDWLFKYENITVQVSKILSMAALGGHLNIIKKFHTDTPTVKISINACVKGQWHIIFWLHLKGLAINPNAVFINAAKQGVCEILSWASDNLEVPRTNCSVLAAAAGNGNLDIINWLLCRNFIFDKRAVETAARNGHLHVLKYFLNVEIHLSEEVFSSACEMNSTILLKWLIAKKCPVNETAYATAAKKNNLVVILWLLGNTTCGVKSYEPTTIAAGEGHVSLLQTLIELDFPFDLQQMYRSATLRRQKPVLKWLNNFSK